MLGLLFGQPERRFQSAEVIRLAKSGTGAVHRQLTRLESVGLITVTRIGNQKHYQARRDSPVFPDLHGLIIKTVGMAEPLRRALAPQASHIRAAFVYGSAAKGTDSGSSDIDVMLISESLHYPEVYEALQSVEAVLGRAVNPTLLTPAEWRKARGRIGSFVSRIAPQPRLFILGSADDLG
ncbi:MAG: nucleotidyltransferase domain-containing protein [Gemmatimonadaceae bacterium]